jgi:CarboxypepD_reg-like domain
VNTRAFILICLSLSPALLPVAAQQADRIPVHGIVTDARTGKGITGVNVFVVGTTFGAATLENGRYEFHIPRGSRKIKLVASMVGYTKDVASVESLRLDEVNRDFALEETIIELGPIVVSSSNKEWKQNLERFRERLFSSTPFGQDCEIMNPTVLEFVFDDESAVLRAVASAPLVIENRATGYVVTLYDARLNGTATDLRWEGLLQFVEMDDGNESIKALWRTNRAHAYMGSPTHFLASLVSGRLAANNFRVWEVDEPGMTRKNRPVRPNKKTSVHLAKTGDPDSTLILSFDRTLLVNYTGETQPDEYVDYTVRYNLAKNLRNDQLSWGRLFGTEIMIDHAGRQYTRYGMEIFGQWAWERLAEQLPFNYQPDPELVRELSLDRFRP